MVRTSVVGSGTRMVVLATVEVRVTF